VVRSSGRSSTVEASAGDGRPAMGGNKEVRRGGASAVGDEQAAGGSGGEGGRSYSDGRRSYAG
jgi:hypothetical protein